MARRNVDSNDAPQGQNGGDIEMGESHIVQAEAAQSSPQESIASSSPATAEQSSQQENTPSSSLASSSSPQSNDATLSSSQDETEKSKKDRELDVELYKAALNGDWETAERKLGDDHRKIITARGETVLHIAAGARQAKFVEKLMKKVDLELKDRDGNTAFCLAAAAGSKLIAEIMIKENPNLLKVRNNLKETPLRKAAVYGQGDMVRFLDRITEDIHKRDHETEFLEWEDRTNLFFAYIDIGLFDLALTLLKRAPKLAVVTNGERGTALHMLARKPSAFPIKSPGIWKTLINSFMMSKHKSNLNQTDYALKLVTCLWEKVIKGEVQDKIQDYSEILKVDSEPSGLLFEAAKLGNFTFLAELVRLHPDLIWELDRKRRTIFHIAVLHRHVSIFNQIHMIGSIKDCIAKHEDIYRNNILHLAATLKSRSRVNVVSGAALQMQRELIWFQEVEKIVQPSYREKKNKYNLTPRELFTEQHAGLLKDGESWMRDRADSCMLVATLITTVVFAAAFTLPGGINNSSKSPNLLAENWFQVFTISDAIAFSSSLFSIMIFLSILTSRYTEEAFLKSLPYKLMAGLLTLFISMIAMMAAFTAAFVVAYHHRKRWAPILISATAFLPASMFVCLQFSLFFDVFRSTFFSKSLFQASKPMIY